MTVDGNSLEVDSSSNATIGGPPATPWRDRTIRNVCIAIAGSALALAAATTAISSWRFGLGVAIGAAMILANFAVLARVGRSLTGSRGGAMFWGSVYLFKVAALFGGAALLFRAEIVPVLSIAVGFGALVPGIVVGGLCAGRDVSLDTQNTRSTRSRPRPY